jgi:hypothetical protein
LLELMPHDERWVLERLGPPHLGFAPESLENSMREVGFGSLTRRNACTRGAKPLPRLSSSPESNHDEQPSSRPLPPPRVRTVVRVEALRAALRERVLVLDGAMGTQLPGQDT